MKRYTLVLGISLALLVLGTAYAQSPGHSTAFGKTLGEWMELDALWRLGGDQDNPEGKMVFLPDITSPEANDGEWSYDEGSNTWTYAAAIDVTLEPGQKFAMPLIFFYGEAYEDGSEDDPDAFDWEALFAPYQIGVWLDGLQIIDSADDDYDDYWYDAQYFDEVIEYDETTQTGAIGITFVTGYGFVHHPLSKGDHQLVWNLYVADADTGFGYNLANQLTLNIEVAKKAKKK